MATWTKIKPGAGRQGRVQPTRESFAVQRTINSKQAALLIPGSAPEAQAERASVYSDGNGKLGFAFGRRGEYRVRTAGPNAKAREVTIPSSVAHRIPAGTTDVSVIRDGDMIVLDLAAIPSARA